MADIRIIELPRIVAMDYNIAFVPLTHAGNTYKASVTDLLGKGIPNGVCPLDENGKVAAQFMYDTVEAHELRWDHNTFVDDPSMTQAFIDHIDTVPHSGESNHEDIWDHTQFLTQSNVGITVPGMVDGKIQAQYIPALAITDVYVVADQAEQDALSVQDGDVVIRIDESKSYMWDGVQYIELISPDGILVHESTKNHATELEIDARVTVGVDAHEALYNHSLIGTGGDTVEHYATILTSDQYLNAEPGTTYPLGVSMMPTTDTGWPGNDVGILTTFKPVADVAQQQFVSIKDDSIYFRKWDDTPPDANDDFLGSNGSAIDSIKWHTQSGTAVIQSNRALINSANLGSSNVLSKYYFTDDFDVEWYADGVPIGSNFMGMSTVAAINTVGAFMNPGWQGFGFINNMWYVFHHEIGGKQIIGQNGQRLYLRMTREGTTIKYYYKANVGDAWTLHWTDVSQGGVWDAYFKISSYASSGTSLLFDDYRVNSGNYTFTLAQGSSWNQWIELFQGVVQADIDASVAAHELTYDHPSYATTSQITTAISTHELNKHPITQAMVLACSDEVTELIVSDPCLTFRMPFNFTLTEVRASLTTASPSHDMYIRVYRNGSNIITGNGDGNITIPYTTKTSVGQVTALNTTVLLDDDEITIGNLSAGNGATGLKVTLIGYKT